MKTKKTIQYSFQHTKQRMMERYGLALYRDEYDVLCTNTRILDGEKIFTTKQKVVTVLFKGRTVKVVFDTDCDRVTTVLPVEARCPKF